MLSWSQQFSIFLFLDNNEYASSYNRYECLLAVNPVSIFSIENEKSFLDIFEWHANNKDWLFGHINYDYKNYIEQKLSSYKSIKIGFPTLHFFCPEIVCYIPADKKELHIESLGVAPETIFNAINNIVETEAFIPKLSFQQKINQQDYLQTIQQLRQHIADGDCYEINFCCEGFCEHATIDPVSVFNKLNQLSPAPFAAFYRLNEHYMMCASPERYIQKNDNKLIAQPIKGTAKRDADKEKDNAIKKALQESIKDKAENVMIVDLMRNDLAKSCEIGSINVDELFGIYSFPQVHQMISTISGKLKRGLPFMEAIQNSFPMGSMTGAPKIKVMELIEQYEQTRRELFSGTVGYISPEGNFDFNVIIRSLFYNAASKYLAYQTGGAITYDSDPQQEWDEMRLKAWALEKIFS